MDVHQSYFQRFFGCHDEVPHFKSKGERGVCFPPIPRVEALEFTGKENILKFRLTYVSLDLNEDKLAANSVFQTYARKHFEAYLRLNRRQIRRL